MKISRAFSFFLLITATVTGMLSQNQAGAQAAPVTRRSFTNSWACDRPSEGASTRSSAFEASLTVTPRGFTADQRLALFNGYDAIAGDVAIRVGNTFPLDDVRQWFTVFSELVWQKIEALDVRR